MTAGTPDVVAGDGAPSIVIAFDVARPASMIAHELGTGASPSPGPSTASVVERELATVWREVLGAPPAADNADFFAVGGDSLTAIRLMLRVDELFDLQLVLEAVFEARTFGGLAALIIEQIVAEAGIDVAL